MEILVLFNDKYAAGSPGMKLNNLVRLFFHINTFRKTENMFGYRVMDYLFKYVKDVYNCKCDASCERLEKEEYLLSHFCNLLAMAGIENHITRNTMLTIMLKESAQYDNVQVEKLVTYAFNLYLNLSEVTPMMSLEDARAIVDKAREETQPGSVSRTELFG